VRATHQRGFSIVAALFLIVVLAAVGAFAVQIGASQQQSINLSMLSARAQLAANAGIEFASNRVIMGNTCAAATTLSPQGALTGFTVRVTAVCAGASTTITVNGTPYRMYTFTSTATRGAFGNPDFVSRTVVRTVTNAPLP
jgi:MSHA biogenesis protein MshP